MKKTTWFFSKYFKYYLPSFLFFSLLFPQQMYAKTLFLDDFTGIDYTQLEQHNNAWIASGDTPFPLLPYIHLHNNQAESYAISEYYLANHSNETDQCASLDYMNTYGNWFNLKIRESETSITFYMASYYLNNMYLRKYVNGDITLLSEKEINYNNDTMVRWKFCAVGNHIKVYLNNNTEADVIDSDISRGTTGFSMSPNNIFDNFLYETGNEKTISFEDVLRDIHNAYLNKQIDNGINVALSAYIKSSQRSYERGDKAASLLDLNNFIRQLNKFNGTKIDPAAFSLLSSDASGLQTLINSL